MRDELNFEREAAFRRIRLLILENILKRPNGLPAYIQYTYDVPRIHVYKELRRLVAEGVLNVEGKTSRRTYVVGDSSMIEAMLEALRPRVANEEKLLASWRQIRLKAVAVRKRAPRGVQKDGSRTRKQ